MGNEQSWKIVWELDNPQKSFWAGDIITGHAYIIIPPDERATQSLFLSYGAQSCSYSSTRSIKSSFTRNWIYSDTRPALPVRKHVHEQDMICVEIRIQLPLVLPPVIYCNKGIALVQHSLQISTDGLLHLRIDGRPSCISIAVYPKVDISRSIARNPVQAKVGSKQLGFDVVLSKGAMVPGDEIMITYQIKNLKEVVLSSLLFELVQTFTVETVKGDRIAFSFVAPDVQKTSDVMISNSVTLTIPNSPYPPTTNFSGGIGDQIHVNIQYCMRCTLFVKALFQSDLIVSLPVVIGTDLESADHLPPPYRGLMLAEGRDHVISSFPSDMRYITVPLDRFSRGSSSTLSNHSEGGTNSSMNALQQQQQQQHPTRSASDDRSRRIATTKLAEYNSNNNETRPSDNIALESQSSCYDSLMPNGQQPRPSSMANLQQSLVGRAYYSALDKVSWRAAELSGSVSDIFKNASDSGKQVLALYRERQEILRANRRRSGPDDRDQLVESKVTPHEGDKQDAGKSDDDYASFEQFQQEAKNIVDGEKSRMGIESERRPAIERRPQAEDKADDNAQHEPDSRTANRDGRKSRDSNGDTVM